MYMFIFNISAVEKKKMYLYEMQIRPWNSRRNNSLSSYVDVSHSVINFSNVFIKWILDNSNPDNLNYLLKSKQLLIDLAQ